MGFANNEKRLIGLQKSMNAAAQIQPKKGARYLPLPLNGVAFLHFHPIMGAQSYPVQE